MDAVKKFIFGIIIDIFDAISDAVVHLLNLFYRPFVDTAMSSIFDLIFMPFRAMSPIVGLTVISIITGILMLWIFKLTSNQDAIRRIKDRISGSFLEIRLFQDDFPIMMRALGRIILSNFIYLRYSMVPLLFMLIPVVILLVHSNQHYGLRSFHTGEKTIVKLKLKQSAADSLYDITLGLPQGLEKIHSKVRLRKSNEVVWDIRIAEPGKHTMKFNIGEGDIEHTLLAGGGVPRAAAVRTGEGGKELFLNPGAPAIPSGSPVERITIDYPSRDIFIFGMTLHWLIIFFVVSLIFGFSVKGFFGVEI